MINFDLEMPETADEAVDLLGEHGSEAKLMAGGQSLLVLMRQRLIQPNVIVSLAQVSELNGIDDNGSIRIGSMTRYKELAESDVIRSMIPLLARAGSSVGSVHIRNRGTIGGALAHCDPSGDVPTALMVFDATYEARGQRGATLYDSTDFNIGIFETRLGEDELLSSIRIDTQPKGATFGYSRFSYREGEYPMAVASCRLQWTSDSRCEAASVAVGGGDAFPKRLPALESALAGFEFGSESTTELLRDVVLPELNVTPDIRGGIAWKERIVLKTLERALGNAHESRRGAGDA